MSVLSKCTGGILVYGTLAAVAILVVSGCGGGSGGGGNAAGGGGETTGADAASADDAGSVAVHREAGVVGAIADSGSSGSTASSSSGASSGATSMYDNTVGNPCTSDLDCQPAGGPGVNKCSNDTFALGAIFPSPVCITPTCDPGTDGNAHFCDGPDSLSPSTRGVCLDFGGNPECLPLCLFLNDGSPAQGCLTNDACLQDSAFYTATLPDGGTAIVGVGYCFGGCTKDADCPTGNFCQVDEGACLTKVVAPTKTIGTACTAADNGSSTTAAPCNCFLNSQTMSGTCSQFCTTGSTADPCPAGYVCEALVPTELVNPSDAGVPGFLTQNAGLGGSCVATCTDEGGTCAGSMFSCSHDTPAGPDCLP